jgi:radical SAM protein with 4Fe4S-binding SPASM domain
VDEYLRQSIGSIFLRPLSPFGFAVKTARAIGYSVDDFVRFYKDALSYILEVKRAGRTFPEIYATLIARKILTPFATGYVDLQSPAGAGFGVVVYNYDGDVYASDEARMLAEMQDNSFRLGNVLEDSYEDIFFGEQMRTIAAASCNEALPGCSDCAFQPYCGTDPVYHYATQGDMFGHRPTSGFCRRNMAIIRHVFELLDRQDPALEEILWAWIGRTSVASRRLPGATSRRCPQGPSDTPAAGTLGPGSSMDSLKWTCVSFDRRRSSFARAARLSSNGSGRRSRPSRCSMSNRKITMRSCRPSLSAS